MAFYDGHKCHKMSFFGIYDGHEMTLNNALWVSFDHLDATVLIT